MTTPVPPGETAAASATPTTSAPDMAVDEAPSSVPDAAGVLSNKKGSSRKKVASSTTTSTTVDTDNKQSQQQQPPPPQPMQRSNSSTGTSETSPAPAWTARNSFTADSPYFNAFCDNEVKQLHTLSDSLREIATRTQTLTRTGLVMSEAAQRLAASCKFQSLVASGTAAEGNNTNADETEEEKQARLAAARALRETKRQAVGEEMASFLEVLGDVSKIEKKSHRRKMDSVVLV